MNQPMGGQPPRPQGQPPQQRPLPPGAQPQRPMQPGQQPARPMQQRPMQPGQPGARPAPQMPQRRSPGQPGAYPQPPQQGGYPPPPPGYGPPPPGYGAPAGYGAPGYAYAPGMEGEKSPKSWVVMLLLTIFLGWIGAGLFYAQRWVHGGIRAALGLITTVVTFILISKIGTFAREGMRIEKGEERFFTDLQLQEMALSIGMYTLIVMVISFGLGILNLVDIILVAVGKYKDGKGLPIRSK